MIRRTEDIDRLRMIFRYQHPKDRAIYERLVGALIAISEEMVTSEAEMVRMAKFGLYNEVEQAQAEPPVEAPVIEIIEEVPNGNDNQNPVSEG